ncbi:MAG: flagellar motor switch phosphatase FliY, partial [Lachnospiraceae bacterium]|nr:flagellar motor switch phosphatase FliY [Lachnospiraceae bacterium]
MDGMLSQEEINALLNSTIMPSADPVPSYEPSEKLSMAEEDAIGEISNISMGTAATTLSTLLNKKVNITTPKVTYSNWENLMAEVNVPCVCIQILYTSGLEGNNILILKEEDVKIITDLMMGGDGTNTTGELTDLHLSAIGEAMNQMMGSASTSMSSMLNKKIDI